MKNQLCSGTSGFTDDAGSCAGDSGSPGVFFDYTRDAYMQVGVLHGGLLNVVQTSFQASIQELMSLVFWNSSKMS